MNIKCNCGEIIKEVAYIDNFDETLKYNVPSKIVWGWINKGKHDEGYLYQCPKCGAWKYYSESELASMENPKEMKKITNSFINGFVKEFC